MKADRIVLIFLGFLLLSATVGACSMRRSEPFRGELDTSKRGVKNGQRLYMAYCQKCHPGGEAGLGPSLNINPAPSFLKRFQVRHGLGVMPSFKKDEISRKDLKDIMRYMKALKHNK